MNFTEPWLKLWFQRDIQGMSPDSPEIQRLLTETAKHIVQKIGFLADLGLNLTIKGIEEIAVKLMAHQNEEGAFLTQVHIPKVFGGSDQPEWTWILCDMPLIVYALAAFGYHSEPAVVRAMDYISALVDDCGWHCSSAMPKFKGPGKREHPCPFATLISLKALAASGSESYAGQCRKGTEMLLSHWRNRKQVKYFLFAMGTDFKKLKYPFVWYDILHVVDVLARFSWVREDSRFKEMCAVIFSKADEEERYKAESVWRAYKGFDFAQKKEYSPTLTLKVRQLTNSLLTD